MKSKISYFLVALIVIVFFYKLAEFYKNHREAELLQRAEIYWDSIRSHDMETAYLMESETSCGTLMPDEVEMRRDWGTRLVKFSLGPVSYYSSHAEISLKKTITQPDTQTGKTKEMPDSQDLWTFCSGKWYHGTPEYGTSSLRRR